MQIQLYFSDDRLIYLLCYSIYLDWHYVHLDLQEKKIQVDTFLCLVLLLGL